MRKEELHIGQYVQYKNKDKRFEFGDKQYKKVIVVRRDPVMVIDEDIQNFFANFDVEELESVGMVEPSKLLDIIETDSKNIITLVTWKNKVDEILEFHKNQILESEKELPDESILDTNDHKLMLNYSLSMVSHKTKQEMITTIIEDINKIGKKKVDK